MSSKNVENGIKAIMKAKEAIAEQTALNEVQDDNRDIAPTSMSDLAIETANEKDTDSLETVKPFRYKPTDSTSAILARATSKTGLTNNDLVTIALILLQNAAEVEVRAAVISILQEKSQALFNSLK
jgi:hypothetical protein